MPRVNLIAGQTRAGDDAIVRLGFPWWLRLFVPPDTAAITLGHRIYIDGMVGSDQYESILDHEYVHVRQARELGRFVFLRKYLAEYFRNRLRGFGHNDAYRAISFEMEAFAAEAVRPYNPSSTQTTHDSISRVGDPATGTLSGASEGRSLAQDRHRSRSDPASDPTESE